MGRTVKERKPQKPEKIQKIELSEKNIKLRFIAAGLFLIIGVGLLVFSFMNFLREETGWTEIEVLSSSDIGCADEFVFLYNVSSSDENKAISNLYTETLQKAYRIFNSDYAFDGVNNLYEINHRPNEEITVDDTLYEAFALIEEYNSRYIYLAPIFVRYDDIFYCTDDSQLADFDPTLNEDVKAEYEDILSFANDPDLIRVELLGDNKVRLFVSEEYLSYSQNEAVEDFISFSWLKNAFIADYVADIMIQNGYTQGSISSYDGFVRNFDSGNDTDYSFNLFDKKDEGIYQAAIMHYSGSISIVYLRSYAINSLDKQRFYTLANGETRTLYLDSEDALCKSSLKNLVCYSKSAGCAEILLSAIPVYISESFDENALLSLKEKEICSIYFKNYTMFSNDEDLILSDVFESDTVSYSLG